MAEHGGYRKPEHPAAVSNPGAGSARTDGGPGHPKAMDMPNAKYGEAADFGQIQSGAALGASGMTGGAPQGGAPQQMPTPLHAPSQNPDQPVTAGADAGAGPGSGVLGLPQAGTDREDLIKRYGPILPLLIAKADSPQSSQQTKDDVRRLISIITG